MQNKFSMRMQLRKPLVTFSALLLLIIVACETEESNFEIGEDLIESKSEIIMVDTFEVQLSTVLIDSIPTSGTSEILTGFYENEFTGKTSTNSYFNFDLNPDLFSIDEEAVFDSVTIKLYYSDYLLGDSTQQQNLRLYRLTEKLALQEDDDYETSLFNCSKFMHEQSSIGELDYYPHPYKDTIEIRINNELGKEIIQLCRDDSDEVADNEKFNTYMKGFVVKTETNSASAVVGFIADSTVLTVYTHIIEEEKTERMYQLNISAGQTHFNEVISDRNGTSFESLFTQREELLSRNSNDMSYLQGGTGAIIRIDFPSLNELFKLEDQVLLKAELILKPIVEYNAVDLPLSLDFYETDKINKLGDQLSYVSDEQTISVVASLYEDILYNENTFYTADISQYLFSILSSNFHNTDEGLLLSLPASDFYTTCDHVILNGENAEDYQPTLKLYFLSYE